MDSNQPADKEKSTAEPKNDGLAGAITTLNETGAKGLFDKIFGRAALAAGDYIGEHCEAWLAEKRRRNVEAHRQAVEKDLIGQVEPSVKTRHDLAVWLQDAQDFGEETPEQAALWRAILWSILHRPLGHESIMQSAQQLSSDEIRLLAKMCISNELLANDYSEHQLCENLTRLQLVARNRRIELEEIMRGGGPLIVIFLCAYFLYPGSIVGAQIIMSFVYFAVMVGVLIYAAVRLDRLARLLTQKAFILTERGKLLATKIAEYLADLREAKAAGPWQ